MIKLRRQVLSAVVAPLLLTLLFGSTVVCADEEAAASCFTSSQAITFAILLSGDSNVTKEFVICPNTVITIGFPSSGGFGDFVGGDWPIIINGDNILLKCGDDGSSDNNCVLAGGWGHIILQQDLSQFGVAATSVNNLKIQGLTFTGTQASLPLEDLVDEGGAIENEQGILTPFVLSVSAPGKNIVVSDCHWRDIELTDIFFVAENVLSSPGALLPDTIDITFANCSFVNVNYTDESGMFVEGGQKVTIERSRFERVHYTGLGVLDNVVDDVSSQLEQDKLVEIWGLSCVNGSRCVVLDSCFDDLVVGTSFFHTDATSTLTVSDSSTLVANPGIVAADDFNNTNACTMGLYESGESDPCQMVFTETNRESCTAAAATTESPTTNSEASAPTTVPSPALEQPPTTSGAGTSDSYCIMGMDLLYLLVTVSAVLSLL